MKKILFLIAFFVLTTQTYANTFIQTTVDGHLLKVVEYDKNSPLYDIKIFRTNTWTETPVSDILLQNNAISWVNWIFFCPWNYSYCKDRVWTTNNEVYIAWEKYAVQPTTWDRVVFAWDKENNPFLFQTDSINMDDEDKIYYWFSNWPLLLQDWEEVTERYRDLWLIDNKMTSKWTRNFICSNKDGSKMFFWLVFDTDIDYLATILKDFGCYNALNLDAGYSTAFIYNGRFIAWPARWVINAVWIVPNFDVNDAYSKANIAWEKILNFVKTKNITKQVATLDNYIEKLNALRVSIYNKYSTDITVDWAEWKKFNNWYKIDVNNIDDLRLVYMINQANNYLKSHRDEILKQAEDAKLTLKTQ